MKDDEECGMKDDEECGMKGDEECGMKGDGECGMKDDGEYGMKNDGRIWEQVETSCATEPAAGSSGANEINPMYSLWLRNVPGMTNIRIMKLLEQVGSSEDLYGWSEERMVQKTTLTIEEIRAITVSRTGWNLKEEWMRLTEMGISFVSTEQREYPARLRNIHNSPFGLYYKGCLPDDDRQTGCGAIEAGRFDGGNNRAEECMVTDQPYVKYAGKDAADEVMLRKRLEESMTVAEPAIPYAGEIRRLEGMEADAHNTKSVAIVGARSRSEYGLQVARQLGETLARNDIAIISGLARGIDADAHIGALDGGGRTYAVLGCGVDICYPRSNRYLYDRILEHGGGILSEYPPGQKPLAALFPQRNRIISGLSDCVVVVEARKKSGSLITADFAMEQGRDVYAVPGRVGEALSEGTNRLIYQGAGIYMGPEEFLADLHLGGKITLKSNFSKKMLEKEESVVYSVLDLTPTGLGTILQKTSIPLEHLLEILASLVDKGYIWESVPNYYVRCI